MASKSNMTSTQPKVVYDTGVWNKKTKGAVGLGAFISLGFTAAAIVSAVCFPHFTLFTLKGYHVHGSLAFGVGAGAFALGTLITAVAFHYKYKSRRAIMKSAQPSNMLVDPSSNFGIRVSSWTKANTRHVWTRFTQEGNQLKTIELKWSKKDSIV